MRSRQQDVPSAEEAARWISRLPSAPIDVRLEFVRWLRQSPMHVRELLLANAVGGALGRFDPERKIDLDALCRRAMNNVVPLFVERCDGVSDKD